MQNMTFTSLHSSLKNDEKSGSKKNKILEVITSLKFLAFLIVVLQIIIIAILINPINLASQLNAVQIINKVSKLTVVPPSEVPVFGAIGDNKVLPDVETLKKDNAVQAQVYKDAKNGDYVLGYTTKMIIYRDSENKIIYDGDSPGVIAQKSNQTLLNSVIAKAKSSGIVSQDSTETPSITVMTNVDDLKKANPDFYASAINNDVLALFQDSKKILIYRADTDSIIKYSDYTFSIK